jgi:predicted Zn finger-like uncharacterized protein
MIVSCPSCDSKYQVADDKVAGSMLRTRCKACGAQIVLDGTVPPPAGGSNTGADGNDAAHAQSAVRSAANAATPAANSGSKPPPPKRMSTSAGLAPGNSKPPPPPMRRTQSSSLPAVSDKPNANVGLSKKPVVDVTSADALNPNASANDFYSKLLSKVGSPKIASQTAPSGPAEPFSPRKTYPPPREPFALANDRMPSHPAPARSDSPHSGQSPQLNSDAPPGDFYAKILAKVKPLKSDEAPASQSNTEGPQTTGGQVSPPVTGSSAPPSPTQSPTAPDVAAAPIREVQSTLGTPTRFSPRATTMGLGEIDLHVDIPGDGALADAQLAPAPAAQSTPLAPQRSEPPLTSNIQLPPISAATESRPPSGSSAIVQGSAVPAQDSRVATKADSTLEPSITSTATSRAVTPSADPHDAVPKQNKRFAATLVTIIGVGLLGVGGGVAATFYALKPSLKAAATQPSAATPVSVAATPALGSVQQQSPPQQAVAAVSAAPAQSQATATAEPSKSDTTEHEKTASVKNVRSANAATPAVHAAQPAATPASMAAAEPRSATKTAAAPAASPTPAKATGSGPFPKEVATAMLGVAASQAPSCKKPGGPTGAGKAIVTFDPDGSVVITNIVGEGFPGTPTGQCVASLFRRVRVPPFGGERAVATKIFTIPQ